MKTIINKEFDKREVGHSTFQVQKQVEQMLISFESKIISNVDELGGEIKQGSQGGLSYEAMGANRNLFCWGRMYRRVPKDWEFPNKMTLRTAFHRYFLVDHKSGVGPLRFLKASDMCRQKNGRRNISNLKCLMKFMTDICKKIIVIMINRPRNK
jgi:hypothetical protein